MPLRRFGLLSVLSALFAVLLALAPPASAQTDPAIQAPPPEKVDQLIKLLADPSVKEWLAKQVQGANLPADSEQPANAGEKEQSMVSSTLDRIKAHLQRTAVAWPGLPAKFERAGNILMAEFADRGIWWIAADHRLLHRRRRGVRLYRVSADPPAAAMDDCAAAQHAAGPRQETGRAADFCPRHDRRLRAGQRRDVPGV